MAEYQERRTVIEDIPIGRRPAAETRPVVETQYDSVIHERRGMSGAAIAALVIAAIAAAVLITMMIVNSNQQAREAELERQRDEARRAAMQPPAAQTQQPAQPQVVVVPPAPQSPPSTVVVPGAPPAASSTAPSTGTAASAAVSDTTIEVDVTTKMLDDSELKTHPINVKFSNGTATLSGSLPSDDLKARAEKVAMTVKGVRRVVNNITVGE